MDYKSGSLVVREAPLHLQQANIVSDTSERPEKRPSLQQDNIMPDNMTKLKKSKKVKETERDEVKPRRGEEEEKKKKKKKKKHSQQSPPSAPSWIWWLAGGPNERKKRSSHKSSKEKSSSKSSSKKHSTKDRSTDKKKKKTTTTTTKRYKHREDESESENDMDDETNSAAGDLGVDDGENDYEMMLNQAKQSYKNHTWIDEHHSSAGSNRTDYPMPPRGITPLHNTGYTSTNGERGLAVRNQGVYPQESLRQNDFRSPIMQDDDRSANRRNISQTSSTSTPHQQSPAPWNNFKSASQGNSTGNVDEDHGALPAIQEEPPESTSRLNNTEHSSPEQNTVTVGRDTVTSSGNKSGVTDMGGDEQESKESAGPKAGENEPGIPEATGTTPKTTEDAQVKEQATESNGSQGNQQESDKSQVNQNESTKSGQSS